MHEMEHLRRADDWTNLLQKAGLVLFPLNPVLLWVERRLCAERELACDDRVLLSTGARKAYAICLTRLAEYSMFRRNLSLALGAWERRSELVRRIHRILRRPDKPPAASERAILTGGSDLRGAGGHGRSGPQPAAFELRHAAHNRHCRLAPSRPRVFSRSTFENSAAPRNWSRPSCRRDRSNCIQLGSIGVQPQSSEMVRRPQVLPNQTAWLCSPSGKIPGRLRSVIIAVSQDHRSSYAAVAIANGWLIVQI